MEKIYLVSLRVEDEVVTGKFLGWDETSAISNAQLYLAGATGLKPQTLEPVSVRLLTGDEANEI